jgi:hypothetical protein
VGLMTRKNRQHLRTRVSSILSDIVNEHGNVHTVEINTSRGREIRQYMNQIDSRMVKIDRRSMGNHMDDVIWISRIANITKANLDEYHNQSYGMDSIAFLNKKFANINDLFDCYNDYIDSNPFVSLKYKKVDKIDLSGVVLI